MDDASFLELARSCWPSLAAAHISKNLSYAAYEGFLEI